MPYFLFINKFEQGKNKLKQNRRYKNMKCFLVEGNIKDAGRMTDEIMNEHMACTRAAMERGMIFMSGLKADMSGGLSVMGAEDAGQLQDYC